MKSLYALVGLVLASLTLAFVTPAKAETVATIDGCYDCLGEFDTPTLVFNNTSDGNFINAQMVLHAYQGDNLLLHAPDVTIAMGTLTSGSSSQFSWGFLPGHNNCCGVTPGDLASYDYDDEYTNTPYQIPTTDCGQPVVGCVAGGGPQWYAQVGNFDVTFTATVDGGIHDGQTVFSVFSPTHNATGGFVGWEGLDQQGFSESPFDIHSGTITDDLANIDLGVPPPPGVPEPAVWAMMLMGFLGAGSALRRRRATPAAA